MTAFLEMVNTELMNLRTLYDDLKKDPVQPQSAVVTTKQQKHKTYYYKVETIDNHRKRTYLGDSSSKKLHHIARSAYKKELIDAISHNIAVLSNIINEYQAYAKTAVLARLSPSLWDIPFDTEFNTVMKRLYDWANVDYEKNPKPFGDKVIKAKDGRQVRSKSECIIYNLLLDAGIPFRYDSVIQLTRQNANGETVTYYESPDFLIMCPDGSLIIIEHAGMLDSDQYAESLAKKLQLYQLCGYTQGYGLFVTSDDAFGGIDSEEIEKLIKIISARFPYL